MAVGEGFPQGKSKINVLLGRKVLKSVKLFYLTMACPSICSYRSMPNKPRDFLTTLQLFEFPNHSKVNEKICFLF